MADPAKKSITLALQGGGAHGAVTWGVLDRLLQEPHIEIEGISGASAGAMNAVVMAAGLEEGGPLRARQKLQDFWKAVSDAGNNFTNPWEYMLSGWSKALKSCMTGQPFEPFNPLDFNPLKRILNEQVDFGALQKSKTKLFIGATNVKTGKTKIFENREMTTDVLLASAALPKLFHPVKIGDEHYWDGGYRSNPPIFPLIDECQSKDLMLVHLNPFVRSSVPRTVSQISDRENELHFNNGLQHELGTLALLKQLEEDGRLSDDKYSSLRMHRLHADGDLEQLRAAGKLDTRWSHLTALRDIGRQCAEQWLREHAQDLGTQPTFDPADVNGGSISLRPGVFEGLVRKPESTSLLPGGTSISSPFQEQSTARIEHPVASQSSWADRVDAAPRNGRNR